ARIIMLTVSGDSDELFAAIRVGATTYLHKEDSIEVVGDAVRAVVAGQTLLTPELARRLIDEFDRLARAGDAGGETGSPPPPMLAPRERAALDLVAEGLDPAAVAARLDVSENTVKNHLRNVIGKLHVHARLAAAGGAADAASRP
ncbi:MAG TPA: response regulator transcription factor, partial [Acidimicrobiales bacterium]|nr:response regulator transcription factor [Acidimicrobiales bacterium]